MHYYQVWIRSNRYHGNEPLTYESPQKLAIGQLVRVPLQRQTVTGFVSGSIAKPGFATKAIVGAIDLPPIPSQSVQLATWVHVFYPAPLGIVAGQFIPEITKPDTLDSNTFQKVDLASLPPLTDAQQQALLQLRQPGTHILHGDTGSGKTRVYLESAASAVANGKSALLLTPEISLTAQFVQRARQVFGERVVLLHSKLTAAQRRKVWQRQLTTHEPLVIIGPRSALFSPLKNIGLIVLDEAHEPAYKQEQAPHYHAPRVAAKLRELHNATLILGSATPSVSDYAAAEQRQKPIINLRGLASGGDVDTTITVVDRKDRSLFSTSMYVSDPLIKAVRSALEQKEQSLLYLNRRGTARLVICEDCGWQAACPHCDLPLTYHGDIHALRCHVCNFTQTPPVNCPDCARPSVVYKTIGTKAVVTEIEKLFPDARIARFDTDNSKSESLEAKFQDIYDGKADIVIGTQLLAKGLDLPKLSVLGVLLADTSLQMPDFTASERTYQLLHQVLGRVGRGHRKGTAIVQTYQPTNPAIVDATTKNWESFYRRELAERKQYKYPPYYHLLKISVRRASAASAEKAANTFAASLSALPDIIIEGPAPSVHEKVAGKYQYQMVIKSLRRSRLLEVVARLPANWSYDIDPVDLL